MQVKIANETVEALTEDLSLKTLNKDVVLNATLYHADGKTVTEISNLKTTRSALLRAVKNSMASSQEVALSQPIIHRLLYRALVTEQKGWALGTKNSCFIGVTNC